MGLFRHTSKLFILNKTGGNKFSKFPKGKASNVYNLTQTEDAAAAVDNGKR